MPIDSRSLRHRNILKSRTTMRLNYGNVEHTDCRSCAVKWPSSTRICLGSLRFESTHMHEAMILVCASIQHWLRKKKTPFFVCLTGHMHILFVQICTSIHTLHMAIHTFCSTLYKIQDWTWQSYLCIRLRNKSVYFRLNKKGKTKLPWSPGAFKWKGTHAPCQQWTNLHH